MRRQSSFLAQRRPQSLISSQQSSMCYAYGMNAHYFFNSDHNASNSMNFQDSYILNHNKIKSGYSEGGELSDLSKIIYSGLDQARKNTQKQKLLKSMEQTYRKQLELEIELCKQLESLTLSQILKEKQMSVREKVEQLEEQIRDMKSEMEYLQSKVYNNNKENGEGILVTNQKFFSYTSSNKGRQYNIVKIVDGKIKIKREKTVDQKSERLINDRPLTVINKISYNDYQNNPKSGNVSPKYLRPSLHTIRTKQSENFSVSPSNPSYFSTQNINSNITHIRTVSSSPRPYSISNVLNQKKKLLLQRRDVVNGQLQLAKLNFDKKTDMMKCEIELLKNEILLMDEYINQIDPLQQQNMYITPNPPKKSTNNRQPNFQAISHRLYSQDKIKKSPTGKRIFGYKSKVSRPSMFIKAKFGFDGLSPKLQSYKSENKFQTKYSSIPNENGEGFQLQLISRARKQSNPQGNTRNEYFDGRRNGQTIKSRWTNTNHSRVKNNIYW